MGPISVSNSLRVISAWFRMGDSPKVLINRQQISISQVLEHRPGHQHKVAPRLVRPPSAESGYELLESQATRPSCLEVRCEIGRYRCVGVGRHAEASAASHIVDGVKRDHLVWHATIEVGSIRRARVAKITVATGVDKVTASEDGVRVIVLDLQRHGVESRACRDLACIGLPRFSTHLTGLDHLSGSEGYEDDRCLPED